MIFNKLDRFNITLTHMQIAFNKYQGTGNDFIIIDNRNGSFDPANMALVNRLCDRRFGIGADGLILISSHKSFDFEMTYFNSDGNVGSMCGNGGRCTAAFAFKHKIAGEKQKFQAFDGPHEAEIKNGIVRLQMSDVKPPFNKVNGNYFINTGSPHYVTFVKDVKNYEIFNEGRKLRYSDDFKPGGTNVNFVELLENGIFVRTYERGVEDETLSCGTGVTASAIASVLSGHFDRKKIDVKTLGGDLSVELRVEKDKVTDIRLSGPGTFVFEGVITI
jgi:diaminopimelate epimerase